MIDETFFSPSVFIERCKWLPQILVLPLVSVTLLLSYLYIVQGCHIKLSGPHTMFSVSLLPNPVQFPVHAIIVS